MNFLRLHAPGLLVAIWAIVIAAGANGVAVIVPALMLLAVAVFLYVREYRKQNKRRLR